MTTHQQPLTPFSLQGRHLSTSSAPRLPVDAPPVACPRLIVRIWRLVRELAAGVDAASMVRHGSTPPADHPARRGVR